MRIATWNVNSIKQRIDNLTAWLAERQPDIVCLQETKCVDDAFPREPLEALGYNVAVHGQKTFNGVARSVESPVRRGDARACRATRRMIMPASSRRWSRPDERAVRVASIYLPNGNPPDTEKYTYKIKWMDRLIRYARERLELEEPLILAGDFNVIPSAADARNPEVWQGDALFLPQTRAKFQLALQSGSERRDTRRKRCRQAFTPSGIIRPAPGRRTTVSGSTTC